MRISYKNPGAKNFLSLRERSGMTNKNEKRAETALKNSLFTVSMYDDENILIGFARVVGDEGISFIVNDVMVDKKHQRKGYGTILMTHIDDYLKENTYEDSYICLIAEHPADQLYKKFGFQYLTKSCGMLRNQKLLTNEP